MAVITPQSDVYLLKVPLEIDNENQLTFANATAQHTYFNSLPKKGYDDFTYIRKDSVLRIPDLVDNLYSYNYVMYRNDAYSNKWFYAYITGMEYVNDSVTDISIATDTFQTWQFDLSYKRTFVEREHVNDDTVGLHTIPEGLETGEYQIVEKYNIPLYESGTPGDDWAICFCVTTLLQNATSINGEPYSIGGVFTSLHFFAVATIADAYTVIRAYDNLDQSVTSDAIKNVYPIPRSAVNTDPSGGVTKWTYTVSGVQLTISAYPVLDSVTTGPFAWQQADHLADDYEPHNNKLFCFPYSYAYFSNKCGDNLVVHWEDFPTDTITVGQTSNRAKTIWYKKALVPSTSLSAKLYFVKYKGYEEGQSYGERLYEYGVNFAKAPVCAWTTDYYTNWLTQNGVNIGTHIAGTIASGGLAVAGAALTGGPVGLAVAGAIIGAGSAITNAMAQDHVASVTPDNANGDINSGDVMFAYNKCAISMYSMSIRGEMAKIIDEYFDAYGYKVNTVKVPNITGRRNWNYVKTLGCYIEADIPQEDLQQIKDMFNKGITFWHNPSTFADYSQNNDII